ncbi:hypothetical protein [Streptomyces werraensis]|uniref:hypothetical protein n=1 Tax=Streptomyces werraensis TaxID=68284 RepID=UPI00341BCD05
MAHTRGSGHGYRPKSERPEPAGAPPHGSPLGSQGDPIAEMHAKTTALHKFVKDRAHEHNAEPVFWESLGYALGSAEALLQNGDIVGAVRMRAWFLSEAGAWENHPDYPVEAAR